MKQKQVAFADFDLKSFINTTLIWLKTQVSDEVDPSYAIVKISASGDSPEFGPESGRSNFQEELENGQLLFFPFSSSNIGEPVECIDGKSREIDYESDFGMGDSDCVGFLIGLKKGILYINSAIHAGGCCPGPGPSVDIIDCDIFDNGMEKFINKFIRQ